MMAEDKKDISILKLGNEFMMRRYLFNKAGMNKGLSITDYIALHIIDNTESEEDIYQGKSYLKDIAEKMRLTIRQTSRMVGVLKERGLVKWMHDGDGSEGTYVTMTDDGHKLLEDNKEIIKEYYGKVINRFGKENLIELLNLMKQLETVMDSELEEMGIDSKEAAGDDDGEA